MTIKNDKEYSLTKNEYSLTNIITKKGPGRPRKEPKKTYGKKIPLKDFEINKIRIDSFIETLLASSDPDRDLNFSKQEIISVNQNSESLDFQILVKMINYFVKKGIKMSFDTEEQVNRVREIYSKQGGK